MAATAPRPFTRRIPPSQTRIDWHTKRLAKLVELNAPDVIIANEKRLIETWTKGFETHDNVLYSDGWSLTMRLSTESDTGGRVIIIVRQWAPEEPDMDGDPVAGGGNINKVKLIVLGLSMGQQAEMVFDNPYRTATTENYKQELERVESEQKAFLFSQVPTDLATNQDVLVAFKFYLNWEGLR